MQIQLNDLKQLMRSGHSLKPCFSDLENMVQASWSGCVKHGDFSRWHESYAQLPSCLADQFDFNCDQLGIGSKAQMDDKQRQQVVDLLMGLYPWRKGPFDLFGIDLDCEWRSDLKWNRLKDDISSLEGRQVLDVGCGSGYHCWRMLGAGAKLVVGIDPGLLFVLQFMAIKHFVGSQPVFVFPQTLDTFPKNTAAFDTVFSMGVLYHRRSPIDHLHQLRDCLRKGGELVLETLVIEGDQQACLVPGERYSCMRNVWFLPSSAMLIIWLMRCGFKDVKLIHEADTSTAEQRPTPWTWNYSLDNFLDKENPKKTIEGYPAPRRAIVVATKI
ncbi:MAG: tRNA 5-methoxyuridine(34)/uridine 5-oxyacetic acid(34) synthase CmoB [Mariprofundaceae bacterium]|nr:tRNA 5-methoxyuridine(34)/uridine 5-oxyacetic acid(34) synthase CmoB [Mariprofundaceae bacterium]